jgi:tetratricopeptide (TPR) repeat protein
MFAWVRGEPSDEAAWDAIDEAARDADSPHEAEALYAEVLSRELEKPVLAVVGRRAIAFQEEWHEDTRRAVEILDHLISRDPENSWAFEKLSLLLTLAERWDDLLSTYDRALVRLDDPRAKMNALEEASRIAKDFAGQAQRASDYLKQLLLLRPADDKLAASLERRLEQQERFADLVDIWRARLSVTEAAEALDLRIRIGNTLLDRLFDAGGALNSAKALLADGVGQDAACDILERLSRAEEREIEFRREALSVLEGRYGEVGREADVVRVLRASLELAPDAAARIDLNKKLVHSLLSLDQPSAAQDAAAAWLRLSPDDAAALARLRDLANTTTLFADFSRALVDASEAILEGVELEPDSDAAELRIQLMIEAADALEKRASDASGATDLFARVLVDAQSHTQHRLLAARRLTTLLVSAAQGGQRLDVLEKLSALEPDERTQIDVLGEAALLAEKLGDPDRALGLWDRRLAKNEADKEALDAKVRILSNAQRFEPLQETLRARFTHSKDDDERRADLVWIARVFEEKLRGADRAIDTWREVELHFGRDAETVDALSRLYVQVERWSELVDFLIEAVAQETDAARRTRMFTTLGDVFRDQRHSNVDATKYYRLALEIDPVARDARQGLVTLLSKEDARHIAAETLAVAYRTADEWQRLLDIAETRFDAEPRQSQQQAILLEAATVLVERAARPKDALGFVTRAFALIPTTEVEVRMQELASETQAWQLAVDGYQQALLGCDDLGRTIELLFEQGRILERELVKLEEALSAYRRILELANNHSRAASAAIRCAGATLDWKSAAWAFVQNSIAEGAVVPEVEASLATSADEQRAWPEALEALRLEIDGRQVVASRTAHDVRFAIACWYRDRAGDFDVAELVLRRAVDDQRDVKSLAALADIQRRHPSRDFVGTLLKLAEIHEAPILSFDEAARVSLEVVGDSALARPILSKTLDLAEQLIQKEPSARDREIAIFALEQLIRLCREGSDHRGAFLLLLRGAGMNLEPSTLLNLKHRAAEISAHQLGDPSKAIELCRQVLAAEPRRDSTISLVATLYEQEAMYEELLVLRQRELELAPELPRRLELRLDMARVQGILGADPDDRVFVLAENLEQELGHPASVDALAEVLAPIGRFKQLFQLLCEQADALKGAGSNQHAAMLYARAGLLAEETLDDVEGAIDAYRKATVLLPDTTVLDSLASIHSAREEFEDAVVCLLQRLSLTPDDDLEPKRTALVSLGRALVSAGRPQEAISHLTQGLDRDPAGRAVRELLVDLHEKHQNWADFARLLAEGVPHAPNDLTKVDYLSRAADALWHRLERLDEAIPLLIRARALAPSDQGLRLVLADALRQASRYDEARELLEGLLAEFGRRRTPERAAVHFQLALICRATHQLEESLTELEAASAIQRTDPVILKTLGDVAREKGELERSERAYRALLLLVGRGQSMHSGIGESAILFELYRLAVERGEGERAKDLLDSAVEAADQDPNEALRLEAALKEAGQWELLLSALERRAGRSRDRESALALQSTRALAFVKLGRNEEALALRLELLDEQPGDAALLEDTEQLAVQCNKVEAFEAKLNAIAKANQTSNPALACDLWLRLGRAAERRGDIELAGRLLAEAQATKERPTEVFRALCAVHERANDVSGLVSALTAFVDQEGSEVDADEQVQAMFRLAELELLDKKKRKAGLARLEAALLRSPDYARAARALQGALEAGEQTQGLLKSFEAVARQLRDQGLLLRALGYWVRREDTTLAQLQEAVSLAEQLKNDAEVQVLLERTVEFARQKKALGDVQWALVRLSEKREQSGDFTRAVELLQDAIKHADEADRFELELRLATLARDGKKDLALAAKVLEKLAEQEPSDARAWKPLLEIYRATAAKDLLERCLSRAEQHVVHDEQRRSLQLERIRLLVDSDRLDEAETSLRSALDDAPDNDEACDLLISLLERQSKSDEVRDLLSARLDAAIDRRDEARITSYAVRLGRLLEPHDVDAAIDVYRSARSAARTSRDLLEALLRLTPEAEARERADLMESLLPTEPAEGVESLALDLARLRLSGADEPGIERAFELGFKMNPRSHVLRERLETWYRERDDWLPLAQLLALDASTRENPGEAIAQYMQAASIYETQLGDASAAADVLIRALDLDPISPALLEPLSQYLLISAQGERAVSILSGVLEHPDLTREVKPILLHLRAAVRARMDENDVVALSAAVDDLDAARSLGGADVDSDLGELLLRLRDVADMRGDVTIERQAVLRLSKLLPELGRSSEALDALSTFTMRHSDDREALGALAALALSENDWSRSMEANRQLFDVSTGEARLSAALRFAEACEHLGVPMNARLILEQIHAEARTNAEVSHRLHRMYEAAGAHAELAELLLSEAEAASDQEQKYALLTGAAELLLKSGEQQERAVEALELALQLVPGDHRATVAVSKAYGLSGRVAEACAILENAIKGHGKRRSRELSELQHAMSVVAGAAGDEEGRFAWLEAALQSDRKNGEVASELAILAQDRGMLDDAVKALQLITLLKEDCPMSRAEAYYRQAVIATQKDDRKKAVLLAKRALGADSEFGPAKSLLQELGEP